MFLLQHKDERHFVYVLFLAQFWVSILQDFQSILYSHYLQCLHQVGEGHALDVKDVVGVKDGLEVFLGQVGVNVALLVLELIQSLGMRVVWNYFLGTLQVLDDVHLCVFRSFIQDSGEYFIEKFLNSVFLHVRDDFLHLV